MAVQKKKPASASGRVVYRAISSSPVTKPEKGITIVNVTQPSRAEPSGTTKKGRPRARMAAPAAYKPIQIQRVSPWPSGRGASKYQSTYKVGPRGGLRLTEHQRVSSSLKALGGALPGAALIVAGSAGLAKMLENNSTINSLARPLPGGKNTLVLGAGLAGGYLAYKYRSLIAFIASLVIGGFALIKLTGQAAASLDEDAEPSSDDEDEPAPKESGVDLPPAEDRRKPDGGGRPLPGDDSEALRLGGEGDAFFRQGKHELAATKYEQAYKKSGAPVFLFNLAYAILRSADADLASLRPTWDGTDPVSDEKQQKRIRKIYKTAASTFKQFIDEDKGALSAQEEEAKGIISGSGEIQSKITTLDLLIEKKAAPGGGPATVQGVEFIGNDDPDGNDEEVAGDDDESEDDLEGEIVAGDDDENEDDD